MLVAFLALFSMAPGRRVYNLDAGWEFAALNWATDTRKGFPQENYFPSKVLSVHGVGTELGTGASKRGGPASAPYPYEAVIDLGRRTTSIGISFAGMSTFGLPKHFIVSISDSPDSWGPPDCVGICPDNINACSVLFGEAVTGRFLKVRLLDGYGRPADQVGLGHYANAVKPPALPLGFELIPCEDQPPITDGDDELNWPAGFVPKDPSDPTAAEMERVRQLEMAKISGKSWQPVTLPHAAWLRAPYAVVIWQGVMYYRRELSLSPDELDKHIELNIEGAMQVSSVWLNGQLVGGRRGGYLPDLIDLSGRVKAHNELIVRVDNLDNPLVPPGNPQSQVDFMYGAGLYRNVYLTVSNRSYITSPDSAKLAYGGGIYAVTESASAEAATLRVLAGVHVVGPGKASVRQELFDPAGKLAANSESVVAGDASSDQRLHVLKPLLWSPDEPHLYRLQTELWQGGRCVDSVSTPIGIRTISVSRKWGFVLNGHPVYLSGTNRHEDYPSVGPALSDAANARDALLIKKSGQNIVRLSNYPQSPSFLDACDRYGLMVIPCTAGWQFFNPDTRFEAAVEEDIRGLIRRDRNHPCVAFWEASLDETYPAPGLAKRWYDCAKSESFKNNLLLAGDATKGAPWDIGYNSSRDDLSRTQNDLPNKPRYIREYGDHEFGVMYGSSNARIGFDQGALLDQTWNLLWSLNQYMPQYPQTMGAGTWEMFDHNVPGDRWIDNRPSQSEPPWVSASGVDDLNRLEKPSAWFFESQFSKTPFLKLYVASNRPPGKLLAVVFSNCERVTLSVDGKVIASGKPQAFPSAHYDLKQAWGPTDTNHLPHPPIAFHLDRIPGEIIATGYVGGHTISDPPVSGPPVGIKAWVDDMGVPVTGNDLVFVRAAQVDKEGRICPLSTAGTPKFTVSGAQIIGPAIVQFQDNIASVLIRTPMVLGPITAHMDLLFRGGRSKR